MSSGSLTRANEQTPLLDLPVDFPPKRRVNSLPKLQIAIVILLQLSEPICSQSIVPYINQLVGELDVTGGDERRVGYYAGLIESLFFAAEALTVLQWGRLSDRIGRRPVMLIGSTGLCMSMLCFGLSRTFWTLIISRCLCGVLNGNVGVMKTVIGELTDTTNRAQGFAIIPAVWAIGATIGPLMGGSLSNPSNNFPELFRDQFWKDYPYFLPCLAAGGFVFLTIFFTFIFFKETLPKRRRRASIASEITLTDIMDKEAPPLRDIMVWPVIISVTNYFALAFFDIMLISLLPLFFAMPVEIGGLGFSPPTIGYLLGGYGAVSGVLNVFFFSEILRRFGEKRVLLAGMITLAPAFLLMPIMNSFARTRGIGPVVWSLVTLEFSLMLLIPLAYGTLFIYITASAPDQRSLGATNGLSQTTASIARAIGPALSTSLFSYSVQHGVLGGYGVYALMIILSLLGLFIASMLPTRVWEEAQAQE